ncbi:MAG TPA: HAD hydrolase family protein [Hanamia sp.]|jgi:3-deoxy-D-manno-octulosonate 8-phosphate phosphatase (KDO 8-P phosphatase)|nr:HAD hydrolase family protein [Hanamia sp.]
MQILSRFKLIKTFAFDMDGVLTDGNIIVDAQDNWLRQMNIRDGYALQLAVRTGFNVMVISGSSSSFVHNRLNKLGVNDVFMNVKNKEDFLKNIVTEKRLSLNEVLYMGDDIPDYFCMKIAGIAACPADAAFEIKEMASYISPYGGGRGCVRDVIEKVLKLNYKWTLNNNIPST